MANYTTIRGLLDATTEMDNSAAFQEIQGAIRKLVTPKHKLRYHDSIRRLRQDVAQAIWDLRRAELKRRKAAAE